MARKPRHYRALAFLVGFVVASLLTHGPHPSLRLTAVAPPVVAASVEVHHSPLVELRRSARNGTTIEIWRDDTLTEAWEPKDGLVYDMLDGILRDQLTGIEAVPPRSRSR